MLSWPNEGWFCMGDTVGCAFELNVDQKFVLVLIKLVRSKYVVFFYQSYFYISISFGFMLQDW